MRVIVHADDRVVARCPKCKAVVLRKSGDGIQCVGTGVVLKNNRIGAECRSCRERFVFPIPAIVFQPEAG
jgi:uncharacterized protein with PIN domain